MNFYFLPAEPDESLCVFTEEELLDYSGNGIEELVNVLSSSDADFGRFSSIPDGTELLDYSLENGLLELNFSGEYGTLSGVRLTEANACLVLTFCQLSDVDFVYVTAEGESMMPQGPMNGGNLVLSSAENNLEEIEILLYLPGIRAGEIYTEKTRISVPEDSTEESAVLNALCVSSADSAAPFLPESSSDLMLWNDETICYVNLTQEWMDFLDSDTETLRLKLTCITDTLAQLDGVEYVQFLLDGGAIEEWSAIGADFPLQPDYSFVVSE